MEVKFFRLASLPLRDFRLLTVLEDAESKSPFAEAFLFSLAEPQGTLKGTRIRMPLRDPDVPDYIYSQLDLESEVMNWARGTLEEVLLAQHAAAPPGAAYPDPPHFVELPYGDLISGWIYRKGNWPLNEIAYRTLFKQLDGQLRDITSASEHPTEQLSYP